jgi:hypothetical protein
VGESHASPTEAQRHVASGIPRAVFRGGDQKRSTTLNYDRNGLNGSMPKRELSRPPLRICATSGDDCVQLAHSVRAKLSCKGMFCRLEYSQKGFRANRKAGEVLRFWHPGVRQTP